MIYYVGIFALSNQRMEKTIMNIAVFASHGGSDLQAIMDGCKNNQINAKVAVVISNNGSSMALQRAADEVSQTITLVPRNQEVKRVWQQRFQMYCQNIMLI